MGCGESKLEHGMVVPVKLRPRLWRRYQDIKRRKNAGAFKDSSNPSKKQLLKDGASEEDGSSSSFQPKSLQEDDHKSDSESSQDDGLKVAPAPELNDTTIVAKYVKVVIKNKETTTKPEFKEECKDVEKDDIVVQKSFPESAEVASEPGSEDLNKEMSENDDDKEGIKAMEARNLNAITEVKVMDIDRDKEEMDKEEEEEEEDRLDDEVEEERYFCPGSPSFRVYLETLANEEDDDDGEVDGENDDKTETHSQSEESVEAAASVNSNEDSVKKTKKKGKRGSRFGKVMPKPRKSAGLLPGKINMKNFLNVKSCYNPACVGHDNARLLLEKAAAG